MRRWGSATVAFNISYGQAMSQWVVSRLMLMSYIEDNLSFDIFD